MLCCSIASWMLVRSWSVIWGIQRYKSATWYKLRCESEEYRGTRVLHGTSCGVDLRDTEVQECYMVQVAAWIWGIQRYKSVTGISCGSGCNRGCAVRHSKYIAREDDICRMIQKVNVYLHIAGMRTCVCVWV
jgi:hypothetical protein